MNDKDRFEFTLHTEQNIRFGTPTARGIINGNDNNKFEIDLLLSKPIYCANYPSEEERRVHFNKHIPKLVMTVIDSYINNRQEFDQFIDGIVISIAMSDLITIHAETPQFDCNGNIELVVRTTSNNEFGEVSAQGIIAKHLKTFVLKAYLKKPFKTSPPTKEETKKHFYQYLPALTSNIIDYINKNKRNLNKIVHIIKIGINTVEL